jgi:hypothetical protein
MRGNGAPLLALWQPGRAYDVCQGQPSDVIIEGVYRTVSGYDPMNGTTQLMRVQAVEGGRTRIPRVLVKDYPILLRLGKED